MSEPKYVDAADYVSEDSDFYGESSDQEHYSPGPEVVANYASYADRVPYNIAAKIRKTMEPAKPLYPTHRKRSHAWQLDESIDDFLKRLPPSTTPTDEVAGWIWVDNPYFNHKEHNAFNLEGFMTKGRSLLEEFRSFKAETQDGAGAKAIKTREIKARETELPKSLQNAAKECAVTTGKWMLFPSAANVDKVWAKVAAATAQDKLGCGAKVAPANPDAPNDARLICVYTRDFADRDDVARVLRSMKHLELFGSRSIYYKPDAFTYLEINSGNEYSLRPSIYSSHILLGEKNGSGPSPFKRSAGINT